MQYTTQLEIWLYGSTCFKTNHRTNMRLQICPNQRECIVQITGMVTNPKKIWSPSLAFDPSWPCISTNHLHRRLQTITKNTQSPCSYFVHTSSYRYFLLYLTRKWIYETLGPAKNPAGDPSKTIPSRNAEIQGPKATEMCFAALSLAFDLQ